MGFLEYNRQVLKARPARAPAHRFIHVGIVAAATLAAITFLGVEAQDDPNGILLFTEGVEHVGVACCVALVLALAIPRSRVLFKIFLYALCIAPAAVMPRIVKRQMQVEYESNRLNPFCDLMECPVPPSLSQFQLEPYRITPDTVYHFKIAKPDLDAVLSRSRFKLATDAPSATSDDPMHRPGPLSIGPNDEIYVLKEHDGEVRTLRVNAGHTEAYLRSQQFIQTRDGLIDLERRQK
jgi:hypothetical protein